MGAAAAAGVLPGESTPKRAAQGAACSSSGSSTASAATSPTLVNTVQDSQEDAARAAAVRGEHFFGDVADREHLAVEGDLAFIARPPTGRPVKADTGAATSVTPAEVPS